MHKRILPIITCLLLLSACFTHKKSVINSKAALQIGMTRPEALTAITDRSELMVAEADFLQGHLVAYQYSRYGKAANKEGKYYLYFMNDTLIRRSEPEDPEEGARIAVKNYYRQRPVPVAAKPVRQKQRRHRNSYRARKRTVADSMDTAE